MSGPGFANLRTFSRSGNKAGQSVDQVLNEAERDSEFSAHVNNPKPPEVIFGMTIDEVRQAHSALLATRKTKVQVKDEVKERAIRKDRHTLAGCVMSYPVPREQVESDADEWQRYLHWRDLNLRWLKKLWGDDLKSVIEHRDEPYLHLHAFGIAESDEGCDARSLNPAYMIKRRALAAGVAAGKTNKEALKAANRAYRDEARKLQDGYHEMVGIPSGLTRFGPRRRRLSRAEWHQEKERARAASDHVVAARIREVERQREKLTCDVEQLAASERMIRTRETRVDAVAMNVANAVTNIQKLVGAVVVERQGDRITAATMGAEAFEALQRLSGKEVPTRADWIRAWSLHDPNLGRPLDMPEEVIKALNGVFDRIGTWAAQTDQLRQTARAKGIEDAHQEATLIVKDAERASASIRLEAEHEAALMVGTAKTESAAVIRTAHAEALTIKTAAAVDLNSATETKTQAEAVLSAAEKEASRLVHEEVSKRRHEP